MATRTEANGSGTPNVQTDGAGDPGEVSRRGTSGVVVEFTNEHHAAGSTDEEGPTYLKYRGLRQQAGFRTRDRSDHYIGFGGVLAAPAHSVTHLAASGKVVADLQSFSNTRASVPAALTLRTAGLCDAAARRVNQRHRPSRRRDDGEHQHGRVHRSHGRSWRGCDDIRRSLLRADGEPLEGLRLDLQASRRHHRGKRRR